MNKITLLIGILIFIPIVVFAQTWESMDGPYFVHNATGISIGTDNSGTDYFAYSVASDFDDQYIYSYESDVVLYSDESWTEKFPLDGAKHVSASRNDLRVAIYCGRIRVVCGHNEL